MRHTGRHAARRSADVTALSLLLAAAALVVCAIGILGHLPSRGERYVAFVASTFGCYLVLVSDRTFAEAVGLAIQVTAAGAIGPRLAEEARVRVARGRFRAERAVRPMVKEAPEAHS
jgi:hypothetical protein